MQSGHAPLRQGAGIVRLTMRVTGLASISSTCVGLSGANVYPPSEPITRARSLSELRSTTVYRQSCGINASAMRRSPGSRPTPSSAHSRLIRRAAKSSRYTAWWARRKPPVPKWTIAGRRSARACVGVVTSSGSDLRLAWRSRCRPFGPDAGPSLMATADLQEARLRGAVFRCALTRSNVSPSLPALTGKWG